MFNSISLVDSSVEDFLVLDLIDSSTKSTISWLSALVQLQTSLKVLLDVLVNGFNWSLMFFSYDDYGFSELLG